MAMKRTLVKDSLNSIGSTITLQGWAQTVRRHGKIVFVDLRDRTGVVQLVGEKGLKEIRTEDVIEVTGVVHERPEAMVNKELATGAIEVVMESVVVLNKTQELPLPIDTDGYEISEEVRLKYRYLDLRRPRLQKNIRLRSQMMDLMRRFLLSHDFLEIETPILTKSTPEGSRDFLVPSRLQKGKFYALPQSPQQYKQLLMVAGFERYFQLAKCIRDEDTRADRGFEFTQLDLEMSFVKREDVMALDEALMISVIEGLGYTIKQKPFPVFTYSQAMEQFGSDKFDLRTEEDKKNNILAFAWVIDFPFFEKTDEGGWTFTHNPFSQPRPEHREWLLEKKNIDQIVTDQYDIVCNGYEVGGGSIRGSSPDILRSVFEIMGYEKSRIDREFGHMLQALALGAPPHGGLAHGIERLLMIIANEEYLREVVAFPQTSTGSTSIMDAPSEVSKLQLEELGIIFDIKEISVFDEIVAFLTKKKIAFTVSEHEHVKTSEEAAAVRGVALSTGAKALLMYGDTKPMMVVLSGDKKIDMKKFKELYSIKDLRMATPEEVKKVTHVEIGAVPPFGHIFSIPIYIDESIQTQETIYFNPGLHTKTIAMNQTDYVVAANGITGNFSK